MKFYNKLKTFFTKYPAVQDFCFIVLVMLMFIIMGMLGVFKP